MVEMKDLLAKVEIFDQGRAAWTDLEGVLVIRDRAALCGGEDRGFPLRDLMQFSAFATHKLLVVNDRGSSR
jgi:hypothetical protein